MRSSKAADLLNPVISRFQVYLPTSLGSLDTALRGGLRLSNVTEV